MPIFDKVNVGMEALDLFEAVFAHYDLRRAEAVKYICEEKPHFAEVRQKNPKAKRGISDALEHTADFTESSIVILDKWDFATVRRAMENLRFFEPKDGAKVYEALKAVSRVRTASGDCHIPLLDLDIPVVEEGPASIEEVARALNIKCGAILDSGKSYHFWGLEPLFSDREWQDFMYNALLLDRIDRRWVGHRLKDRQANLRISSKYGKVPKVVHVFDVRR